MPTSSSLLSAIARAIRSARSGAMIDRACSMRYAISVSRVVSTHPVHSQVGYEHFGQCGFGARFADGCTTRGCPQTLQSTVTIVSVVRADRSARERFVIASLPFSVVKVQPPRARARDISILKTVTSPSLDTNECDEKSAASRARRIGLDFRFADVRDARSAPIVNGPPQRVRVNRAKVADRRVLGRHGKGRIVSRRPASSQR